MCTIFINSLHKNIKRNPSVSLMLFLGVFVAVLCISIMLGHAFGQYETVAGYTSHATLTIVPQKDILVDIGNFSRLLNDMYGDKLANVLYISNDNENGLLIGWEGTTANRWFPYSSGRFFTEQEQIDGAEVVFISSNYDAESTKMGSMDIKGKRYKVIGSGWIEQFNIQTAISSNCTVELFSTSKNDTSYVQIIPYKCFIFDNIPVLILVHFDFASTEDLQNYSNMLQDMYPDSEIYLPDNDSDEIFVSQQISGVTRALIIGVIVGITLIQLAQQWGKGYKKELYVYHICGMSRMRCMFIILGHWSIYFVIASITAITTHILCIPILDIVEANYTPQAIPLLIVLVALYCITSIFSFWGIRKSIYSNKTGDVL